MRVASLKDPARESNPPAPEPRGATEVTPDPQAAKTAPEIQVAMLKQSARLTDDR